MRPQPTPRRIRDVVKFSLDLPVMDPPRTPPVVQARLDLPILDGAA